MKKVRISVTGRVQGVGFRYFTKKLADTYDIKGMVRNETDGSVYIEAIGDEEVMDQFIGELKNNPTPFSSVEKVQVTEDASLQNFLSFNISN